MMKNKTRRERFTDEEISRLEDLVDEYGLDDWETIAKFMEPRTSKQCREFWVNNLSSTKNAKLWTKEEDNLLIQKHNELGDKWDLIRKFFSNRSKNNIINRWRQIQAERTRHERGRRNGSSDSEEDYDPRYPEGDKDLFKVLP